ncbi:hypothetical protein [Nocardia neocaledoniensis]|uniref:hypothetical protein n=1 Tax=Nocardia neocaledoniensis TaxID=236511 RepID=UPI002456468C|nr:hypothetical protein [Nocardia neocaledoniensis]
MTETRQQRRARERAAQKTASRPGANLRPVSAADASETLGPVTMEVEINWFEPQDGAPEFWSAQWGEQESEDESVPGLGVTFTEHGSNLPDLIDVVLEDIRARWANIGVSAIDWSLDRKSEQVRATEGIELPARV